MVQLERSWSSVRAPVTRWLSSARGALRASLTLTSVLAACAGDIGEVPSVARGPGDERPSETGALPGVIDEPGADAAMRPQGGAAPLTCTDLGRVGAPVPLRRLTASQVQRSVADILGVHEKLSVSDERIHTFRSNVSTSIDVNGARSYYDFAERVAAKVDLKRCATTSCLPWLLDEAGLRLFRRPLSPEQRARYERLHQRGGADGPRWVLSAMLQSGTFLYLDEVAQADGYLDGYGMAARLALVLWGSNPDVALLTRAGRGELSSVERIREESERMLADPRSEGGVEDFVDQWLELHRLDDPDGRPDLVALGPAVLEAMRAEPVALFRALLAKDGSLTELLTTAQTVRSDALTSLYGRDILASTAASFTLDPTRRAGLLSLPGVMAALAHAEATSPTLRGYTVLASLLCSPPPPPPAGVVVTLPEVGPNATARERLEVHFGDASCGSCHRTMDGIGFAYESFDWLGRSRELDRGLPIDDVSKFRLSGEEVTVDGPAQLAAKLAASADVADCFGRQWARYATGVQENDAGECLMRSLGRGLSMGGGLKQMMFGYLTSDWFRRARAGS